MKLHIPDHVQHLKEFYGALLYNLEAFPNITAHLAALAQRMHEGVKRKEQFILQEISNYHKDYLGKIDQIDSESFSLAACRQTIANEHGFSDWTAVEQLGNISYDLDFESAVNDLLAGNLTSLEKLISAKPDLLVSRSVYGHNATLLHYTASNGVEMWRQQVPLNLPEITALLLDAGADKAATMSVYNGEFITYELLVTSIHPLKAGIMEKMKSILKED